MRSTFRNEDVIVLQTDLTGRVKAEVMEERERLISLGIKAYEMIPFEESPTVSEINFYEKVLEVSAEDTAFAVGNVAEKIYRKKGASVVLVSLARGGLAAGILIKRYLKNKYKIDIPHYAITLIGTMGIDKKAIDYLLENFRASDIQFIDGWIGKGAVSRTLTKALDEYKGVSPELAVLSDPANLFSLFGTHDDILIPSACLNATLAGLLSRAVPIEDSFFGAIFFEDLEKYDKTYHFIDNIEKKFSYDWYEEECIQTDGSGLDEVKNIAKDFNMPDIHFIKPGMGEAVRAFIRKKPDIVLIKNIRNKYTKLMEELATINNVLIKEYPLIRYNACSIYKDSNSDVL